MSDSDTTYSYSSRVCCIEYTFKAVRSQLCSEQQDILELTLKYSFNYVLVNSLSYSNQGGHSSSSVLELNVPNMLHVLALD
jgi:hypothetical protein